MRRDDRTGDAYFELGSVRVVVTSRFVEALAAAVDAIVSSDDTMLSMSGGVSKALLKMAGPRLKQDAERLVPLRIGDVAVTSAGTLPATYVLHAVSVDWVNGVMPTERTIRQLSREVFRRCEALGIRRLAVAALATGAAGFSAPRAAHLVVQSLAEHAGNPTVLETVTLSLPDLEVRRAFEKVLHVMGGLVLEGLPHEASTGQLDVARSAESPVFSISLSRPEASLAEPGKGRPVVDGRYVLLEELGRGGMGVVYLAWDLQLRRTFAIKVLRPDRPIAKAQLEAVQREAAIWIGLNHESILRLHHFEPWDDTVGPYLVLEYLDWDSGDRWIANAGVSGLPPASVLRIGVSLCRALECAHGERVLHGDIKPSNFFVDQAGARAKLTDFGLARVVGAGSRSALLVRLAGTPDYMAPEQKRPGAQITPATDVYLLAASLWECLTGALPRPGKSPGRVAERRKANALASIKKGLAPDAGDRPQTAREFGTLLQEALERF